ncbi:MAG: Fe-S-binding domain-containing protein, partial [Caldilineaceae bacterium]|nr:Fe-S-binding domain-containing protein [Caldilineaceae bacterium]
MNYLLSIITFLPLVGAIAVLAVPDDRNKKYTALGVTLVTFLISLALWIGWDSSNAGMQFVEDVPWLPQMGLRYHLGVDGISLFLVLLTTFIMIIAVAFSNEHVTERVGPYLALMLALQTAMTGVFVALDMIL